jgi:threonine/homoserine/homoserine lactone efflux protein
MMGGVDLHVVLAFVAAAYVISLVPGPDMLFIVANGVAGGRRAGVTAALGVSTGLLGHTLAAAFGLGILVQRAPEALRVVRIAGAVVLLVLAVTTWRAARRQGPEEAVAAVPRRSLRRTFALAALTNLANPKVILFYLAFVPQFVTLGAGAAPVPVQMLVLGAVLIVVGLSVDGTTGLLSGTLSDRLRANRRLRRRMERASAGVFAALATRLVLDSR